jgi:hypothetical protein
MRRRYESLVCGIATCLSKTVDSGSIGNGRTVYSHEVFREIVILRRFSMRSEEAAVAAQRHHARTGEIRVPPTPTGHDPAPPPRCRPHAGSVAARADESPRGPPSLPRTGGNRPALESPAATQGQRGALTAPLAVRQVVPAHRAADLLRCHVHVRADRRVGGRSAVVLEASDPGAVDKRRDGSLITNPAAFALLLLFFSSRNIVCRARKVSGVLLRERTRMTSFSQKGAS